MEDFSSRAHGWRRLGAVLVGAMVTSLGFVQTLAVETSQQTHHVTLRAGRFDLETSVDGHTFSRRNQGQGPAPRAASIDFDVNGLSPGQRVYQPGAIRLASGTDYAARVRFSLASQGAASPGHSWVYRTQSFGCDGVADLRAAVLLLDSRTPQLAEAVELRAPTPGRDGDAVNLCFVVAGRADLVQGEVSRIAWAIQGESLPG